VKFSFIAKHRGIWPADWLCGALGVSRGGFYAWLTRPRSQRSRDDEALGAKVRASFLASDRTYGARRVWRDLLTDGLSCGLHRVERLMRLQALKARPRRRRLPPDLGERQASAVATNVLDRSFEARLRTANGLPTSPTSGRPRAGSMSRPSSICSPGVSSVGR
jgi:putative transposase